MFQSGGVQSLVKFGCSSMEIVAPHPLLVVLCLFAIVGQGLFLVLFRSNKDLGGGGDGSVIGHGFGGVRR